jgi:predicted transcriptional regulator of viral defense system
MKNIIIILILVAAGWFLISRFAPDTLKPSKTIINAGASLKNDEDRAKDAANIANKVTIQNAVNSFKMAENKYPSSLQDLVEKKYLDRIPSGEWKYNAETGEVSQ